MIGVGQSGAWLLVDNVNFCAPTVLDRLNALLERGGTLLVSERGLVDGQVRVVRPHRNFRLVMAMNAQNGEISRAMRNRAVEICLLGDALLDVTPPPSTTTTTTTTLSRSLWPLSDDGVVAARRVLASRGYMSTTNVAVLN